MLQSLPSPGSFYQPSKARLVCEMQVISVAAGKSCTFLSSAETSEHGSAEVCGFSLPSALSKVPCSLAFAACCPHGHVRQYGLCSGEQSDNELRCWMQVSCTISVTSASTHGEVLGSALMRLPMWQTECEDMCPIWLHKPQALPLCSPATGVQTALLCISLRLVQRAQKRFRARPVPSAPPCPASSQVGLTYLFVSKLHIGNPVLRMYISLGLERRMQDAMQGS